MKNYETMMNEEEASLYQALEDFVIPSTYDEEKYMDIYKNVMLPMFEYPHTVSNEIFAKLYHIFAAIDINTFLKASTTISDENFVDLYDLSNAIESSLGICGNPSSVPQYGDYIEKRDSLYEYLDSYVDSLKKDILAFDIDKDSLSKKYMGISERYFRLRDFADTLLSDEEDEVNAVEKFQTMTISYIIYDFFEKIPTLNSTTYNEARKYLLGYDSFEDFKYHEGAMAYINLYIDGLSEESKAEIYRYQDYLNRLNEFNDSYASI